uniref:Uncharacterized protein n=1 Tax=Bionectria ochroleuca TaxID=29856 RepID=A0A8H7NQ55_BIOOC
MPSRTNPTAPFNRDPEDSHDAFLADEDESNSSVVESHYNDLPDNTNFFHDAIASGQEQAAMFPEEVQEPRIDHSDTHPRLVPFPSRSSANLPDAFRPGYLDNPATMPNPYRFPDGAPTQPAERPALWEDTSSSTPPFPTVSPAATSFAARASRLSSHYRRSVDFSPSPPSPSCLAYPSTARLVRGNNPYQRGAHAAHMLSNVRLSAGATAAVATNTDLAMPLLEGDTIDALRRERERKRTYTGGDGAERVGRLRMNVGPGAHSVRRRKLAHRPRRPFGNLSTCFDNMVHANRATFGGETSQEAAAQNLALREAQRFLHECIDQRRARREAQQQEDEDAEEGEEPASTTDDEREHEDEDEDEEY